MVWTGRKLAREMFTGLPVQKGLVFLNTYQGVNIYLFMELKLK